MVGLWVVLPEDVFHAVVDRRHWMRFLFIFTTNRVFSEDGQRVPESFVPSRNTHRSSSRAHLLSPHMCTVVLSVQVKIARLLVLTSSLFFLRIFPIFGLCITECFTHNIEEVAKSPMSYTFSFDAPILHFFKFSTSIVLPSRVIVGSRP